MKGHFSERSLATYSELIEEAGSLDFSEVDSYDFTRCIRKNGSAYGTRGKCRSGTEAEPLSENKGTAREMRKGLVERVKSHMALAKDTKDGGAKDFYKGEAKAAAKKLKTLGRADRSKEAQKRMQTPESKAKRLDAALSKANAAYYAMDRKVIAEKDPAKKAKLQEKLKKLSEASKKAGAKRRAITDAQKKQSPLGNYQIPGANAGGMFNKATND
jgi:hypothetical protein